MSLHVPESHLSIHSDTNLFHILAAQSQQQPQKVYVYGSNSTITYKEMCDLALQLGQKLPQLLDGKSTLAVSSNNSQLILPLVWGCLAAGVCLAFLPATADAEQLWTLMTQIDAKLLVTDTAVLHNTHPWAISFAALTQTEPAPATPALHQESTPAFIFQTSGTTGTPKWIQVTHGHFTAALSGMKQAGALDHTIDQVACITPPLSHSYGLSSVLEYSYMGASIVLPAPDSPWGAVGALFDPTWAEKISAIEGVPHFYAQMARLLKRVRLPNLRHAGLGGGRLSADVMETIRATFPNLTYSVRYGLTETPSVVSHKLFRHPYTDDWSSSGRILPLYALRIVDENGRLLPPGQQGEIAISGAALAWPYLGETAVSDYFATGDIGYINEETQELHIVGRKSFFLKVRGYRLSPESIEAIINTFAHVLDSRVSASESGIVAEIVPAQHPFSQPALLEYLATKLPAYALPKTITLVTAVPRTHSGKIKRQSSHQ